MPKDSAKFYTNTITEKTEGKNNSTSSDFLFLGADYK